MVGKETIELTKYKDYVRKGAPLEFTSLTIATYRTNRMMDACADAYGYLAGIDATHLGLADDVLSDRVALAMDSLVEACAYAGIDIREHKIK